MKKIFNLFLYTIFLSVLLSVSIFNPSNAFALPQNFVKTVVTQDLYQPADFVIAPDNRIFIAEKQGKIKVLSNSTVLSTPFVQLTPYIEGDAGVLGITLDPDFSNNHYIYIIYVNFDPKEVRVSRFTESNNKAISGSEKILIKSTGQEVSRNHHGGGLVFGPDGKLWVAIGENNNGNNSQDLSNIFGKVLRINKDGSIPSDNPYVGQSGKDSKIWASGFRNPFRMSFAPDGRLLVADVGGDDFEEINVVQKAGNFGWPHCEGSCTKGYINPLYSYPHTQESRGAIAGGVVYTGNEFPNEYKNNYFFGDFVRGFIKRMSFNAQGGVSEVLDFEPAPNAGSTVSFKQGSDGSLFFLTVFPGILYKVTYTTANQAPIAKIAADKTFGDKPLTVKFSSNGSSDPEGKTLTYKWDFGDKSTSTEANPTYTYKKKGTFTAKLTVNDGKLESQPVSVEISVGNFPPTIDSLSPVDGFKYNAGDKISYSGKASDPEKKKLPDSAYSWDIIFHHVDHIHPFLGPIMGKTSGSFTIPNTGEFDANIFYEIRLTVTDNGGLRATKSIFVRPNKINLTLSSEPSGLELRYNSTPYFSPKTLESVVGFKHTLEAPLTQVVGGTTYTFESWSDGGAAQHTVIAPNTNVTYKAIYKTGGGGGSTSFMINPGETKNVPANSVISGDVKVNGQALYDSDGSTGLAVLMEQAGDVNAPWGATVYTHSDRASAEAKLNQVADDMKTHGCGSSCGTVTKYFWPSGQTTVWSAPSAAPQGSVQPEPTPTESPSPSPAVSPSSSPSVQPITSPEATPIPSPSIESSNKDDEDQ